jgi:Predicted esterase of the alpha-beta hydrolase superfamily
LITTGCTAGTRTPISEIDIQDAAPYGIKGVRVWGDELGNQQIDTVLRRQVSIMKNIYADAIASGEPIHQTFLALSGGGPDGAFGAGLLAGWTKRGDRPEFDVVTGVSTGAIVGLFAFLGPEFDQNLQEIYTEYKTDQLIEPTIFSALTGGTSITDATGYNTLIDKYIDDNVVALIAEEARKGRLLLIGTTNLDAARPVVWNVTNIAASGHPNAKALIRDLVRASSAIPAVFPPILIPSSPAP